MPISNDPSREVTVIAIHAKFGASQTSYAKDLEIYRQSEPADRVFEVIEGAVRSYKVLSDRRRQILHSLEYVAATDVRVARDLLNMTANNLRRADDHMLLLGRKLALEKVAAFLLEMDKRLAQTGMIALPMH